MRKQNFIQGTVILIITMSIVKFLGLINRFIIARILTTEGIGIYMLVMPTFILLIALSQLGFPISISKLVSENEIKKSMTNKSIILSASKLALINSVILISVLLVSAKFLSYHLLHDGRTYYPILALSFFIPLVSFSSILKGYLHGLRVINIPPYIHSLTAIAILVILQKVLAYISLKNTKVRSKIEGTPSVIIANGKVDYVEMRKNRYTFDDLMVQLRDKGAKSISEVEFAILESSGTLSVFKKEENKLFVSPLPLIVSGELIKENFQYVDIDEVDFRTLLKNKGYQDFRNIMYANYENNELFIVTTYAD